MSARRVILEVAEVWRLSFPLTSLLISRCSLGTQCLKLELGTLSKMLGPGTLSNLLELYNSEEPSWVLPNLPESIGEEHEFFVLILLLCSWLYQSCDMTRCRTAEELRPTFDP